MARSLKYNYYLKKSTTILMISIIIRIDIYVILKIRIHL
jgi:hypothetical protein